MRSRKVQIAQYTKTLHIIFPMKDRPKPYINFNKTTSSEQDGMQELFFKACPLVHLSLALWQKSGQVYALIRLSDIQLHLRKLICRVANISVARAQSVEISTSVFFEVLLPRNVIIKKKLPGKKKSVLNLEQDTVTWNRVNDSLISLCCFYRSRFFDKALFNSR